ncbi:MAG: hypothetical protein RBU21_13870 [FCB group bacterium]|jgi:hypothetical protein|nr:hypothetical protein [FCB group bacterium]
MNNAATETPVVRHDADSPLPRVVPWPVHYTVSVQDEYWYPADSASFSATCPRCRGLHELKGGQANYCPYCGEHIEETALNVSVREAE